MNIWITLAAVAAACGASCCIIQAQKKSETPIPPAFVFLTLALPFAAGGFYTYLSAPICVLLLAELAYRVKKSGKLTIYRNPASIAVAAVVIGYCLTPLWAADHGMAIFGIARAIPLLLCGLCLMQYSGEERAGVLSLVPICGAAMTVAGFLIQLIPGLADCVLVAGRLAGFFQYPNTFAVFLLAGLILQVSKGGKSLLDNVIRAILILGVIASGSRTSFVLLVAAVVLILLSKPGIRSAVSLLLCLGVAIGASFLLAGTSALTDADRFTTISPESGTFLIRLLYFKDALGAIVSHPFGLGYWGYRAVEPVIQTGRYSVSYVHNELLQLFLDVGWIPAVLMAVSLLRTIFSKGTQWGRRALLLIVLAHCMMDFDLQFLPIWVILLAQMDLCEGRVYELRRPAKRVLTGLAVTGLVCVWLSCGDFLMQMGKPELCLRVTPFHTEALTAELSAISKPAELDKKADQILSLNSSSSTAYSAKANAAFSRGDILSMVNYKEQAISLSRYSVAEYCDYIDKLYYAYQLYLNAKDASSAEFCREKILGIPDMLDKVELESDALAYMTQDDAHMDLPEEYVNLIESLRQAQ